MKNYGNRVDGPWIFGISWYKSNEWKLIKQRGYVLRENLLSYYLDLKLVFFYVNRRDKATLHPLIERHIAKGTEVHSDEWRAYSGTFIQLGFKKYH